MKCLQVLVVLLAAASLAAPQAVADDAPASLPSRPRAVLPRELLTPLERALLRARLEQATPEERMTLWRQELVFLQLRAAARGVVMTIVTMRPDGTFYLHETRGVGRILRLPPRAP